MSRLIDADKFEEFLWNNMDFMVPKGTEKLDQYEIKKLIDAQPTAYDVEKVVEEIKRKHCKKCRNILDAVGAEEYCKEQKCEIDELCDIVRKGGAE